MEPMRPKLNRGTGPEAKVQTKLIGNLKSKDWFAVATHSNEYQMGLPDVFAAHRRFGYRWIEVKNKDNYSFTGAQLKVFPEMSAAGVNIWVLTDSNDWEINKLFSAANWFTYLQYTRKCPPEPKEPKRRIQGPEAAIQIATMEAMRKDGWFVIATHGNEFQMGLPDLYAAHKKYGTRWIEMKNPSGYTFTPAQIDTFPQMSAAGIGIWVLTDPGEYERRKLFDAPNWYTYLR